MQQAFGGSMSAVAHHSSGYLSVSVNTYEEEALAHSYHLGAIYTSILVSLLQ